MFSLLSRYGVQFLFVAMCVACGGSGGNNPGAPSSGTGTGAGSGAGAQNHKAGGPSAHAPAGSDDAKILSMRNATQIPAATLLKEYQANEVAADQAYRGRHILVKGVVDHIGKDLLDQAYVSLKGGEKYAIFSVQAYFAKNSDSALASLRPGHVVLLYGKCRGKSLNVLLDDCQLVSESDLSRQTSQEVAAAEAADKARREQAKLDAERLERERPAREKAERERAAAEAEATALAAKQQSERSAAGALALIKALITQQKYDSARDQLRDLVKKYPGTLAAEEAAKLLKTLPAS